MLRSRRSKHTVSLQQEKRSSSGTLSAAGTKNNRWRESLPHRGTNMKQKAVWACTLLLAGLSIGLAQAADLTVRVDAREVAHKRVHTELTLAVKPGPLTLVFAKWMPGEHGPTGPLASMIGLEIKANGERLSWSRDPLNMYALRVAVPHGVDHLDVSIDSGLATEGGGGTDQLGAAGCLVVEPISALPGGVDADKVSVSATIVAPSGWTVVCALGSKAGRAGSMSSRAARWRSSSTHRCRWGAMRSSSN